MTVPVYLHNLFTYQVTGHNSLHISESCYSQYLNYTLVIDCMYAAACMSYIVHVSWHMVHNIYLYTLHGAERFFIYY